MRVLQVVKTSDGAQWAARQAAVLGRLGVDVHVVLPSRTGRAVLDWERAGATIHLANLALPVVRPYRFFAVARRARELVASIAPDIIHSHFVNTTCLLRLALGRKHPVPRIYQVAGPLHLEHWWSRRFEIGLAGASDVWIGSSRCINNWYRRSGVPESRLFLSYWGFETRQPVARRHGELRTLVGARPEEMVVGNISWMYPPKRFLGQQVGLKCHEDMIRALAAVCRSRPEVLGVFVGGAWNGADWYEARLRRMAQKLAGDRIRFAGALSGDAARRAWGDFDLAIHVPLSENCGGVIEPLSAGVPVIASDVGGLPEVVLDQKTGILVPPRAPAALAKAILQAVDDIDASRRMAARGKELVDTMFDHERNAQEVFAIYRHLLDPSQPRPAAFDSAAFLGSS